MCINNEGFHALNFIIVITIFLAKSICLLAEIFQFLINQVKLFINILNRRLRLHIKNLTIIWWCRIFDFFYFLCLLVWNLWICSRTIFNIKNHKFGILFIINLLVHHKMVVIFVLVDFKLFIFLSSMFIKNFYSGLDRKLI